MAKENDVVLIYFEDKPLSFARVESILPDSKPNWYHAKLLLLQVPLQVVTWILRDVYINGEEFTMNGKRMRLEPVAAPASDEEAAATLQEDRQPEKPGNTKVISFEDRKKL